MLIFLPYGVFKAKGYEYLRKKQNPKILIEAKILRTAVRGLLPTEMNPNEKTRHVYELSRDYETKYAVLFRCMAYEVIIEYLIISTFIFF